MSEHKTVGQIEEKLREYRAEYTKLVHAPVRTSEEAHAVRPEGYSLAQGAKALLVRYKKEGEKHFALIVVPGDKKFDKKKVMQTLGSRDVRFATEDEVRELTCGVEPGGVPPFGSLFGLTTYADESVFDNETIIFNAGDKAVSLSIRSSDYRQVEHPIVVSFV